MTKPAFLFDGRKILDHDVRYFTQFHTSILSAFKLSQPDLLFERIYFLIMILPALINQDWLVKRTKNINKSKIKN